MSLCLTAYMGDNVMFFDIENAQLTPFLLHTKPVIGVVIILIILLNNKGRRTIIALEIAAIALLFSVSKTYYNTAILPDWLLYTAFFFAIWYNGNFQYFYRIIRYEKQ